MSIGSENFVNESCLSHRDEAFDTKFDKLMLFNDFWIFEYDIRYSVDNAHLNSGTSIFGFSILDYIVWTHFQENNFGAVPSFPVMLHFCIKWPICRRQKMIFRRQLDIRMTCLSISCVFVQKKEFQFLTSESPRRRQKDDSSSLLIFAKKIWVSPRISNL